MARREVNGETVRALREALGITQPELAKRCGITQPSLSNIERGERNASPRLTRAIADQLGVGVAAITSVIVEPVPS